MTGVGDEFYNTRYYFKKTFEELNSEEKKLYVWGSLKKGFVDV